MSRLPVQGDTGLLNGTPTRREILKGGATLLASLGFGGGLASFIEACGGSSSSSGTLGPDTSGTLTVWHYFPSSNAGDTKFLADLSALFNKKYPKVTVNLEYVAEQQFTQKVVAAAGVKQGPDILIYGDDDINPWIQSGAVADYSTYWHAFADKAQFPAGVLTYVGDKLYAAKTYTNLVALYYNKDILDSVGVAPPSTMDELDAALAKVAAAGKKYIGYSMCGIPHDAEWVLQHFISAYGFSYDNPSGSNLQAGLQLLASWVQKGYVPKESANWDQQEAMARFLVGNVAFCNNGNWRVKDLKNGAAKFKFGIAALPTATQSGKVYLGGEDQFMGAFSKNKDLAWAYLENSWFAKEGGSLALSEIGSIPSRLDVAPEAGADPLLQSFLTEIKDRGAPYPPKAGSISPLEQKIGQQLSVLLAGQQDGTTTAQNIVRLATSGS
jgi:multiple sugar transport system substrate-binding protein